MLEGDQNDDGHYKTQILTPGRHGVGGVLHNHDSSIYPL